MAFCSSLEIRNSPLQSFSTYTRRSFDFAAEVAGPAILAIFTDFNTYYVPHTVIYYNHDQYNYMNRGEIVEFSGGLSCTVII